jgi:Flp pilus assembly protein TadD
VALRQVLAKLYADASQPEKTGEQLRKIVELQPADFSHRFQLAVFYAGIDRIDDAQRVLTEAVKLQPANGEAKLALVDFISTRRSRAEGEKTLRDFVAREPSNYDLRLGLGALLQRAGSSQEAIAVYREVIKLDGTGAKGLAAQDRIAAIELALGHFDVAQKLVNEVLAKNSHDNEALALRGDMELRRNDPTAAIADLRVVLRDQPGAQLARRALARAYLANGEPGLAEEALRIAMEGAPNDPAVRIELAQVLSQRQHGEQAVALLEETVRHSPTDVSARQALARTYLQAHNFVAARTTAEDLKTLQPQDASGFYLAALADEGMHKLDDSQKELESALQVQPEAIDALTELVHVYFASGKPAQALARVQEAVDRSPTNALPLNLLGEVLFTTRDFPKAEQTFLRAISLSPTWPVPYRNRAVTRLAMGDKAGAIAAYELAVKAFPADPQLTVDLATWYEKERRIDDAIRCYEALHQHNPHLQLAANNLALLLASYKSDRASLDRARSLTVSFASSQSAELLDTSGWVQFKRGEYASALPILQRAAERSPGSVVIRYHLGMAELQAGQRDRARTHLESVLSADGKFPEADEARIALARLKNSIS